MTESGFKNEFDVRLGPDGLWIHLDDVVWEGSDGDRAVVPKGRTTDFASVPRLAQALLPSADPRVVRAAAVHDELCRELDDFWRAAVSHFNVERVSRRQVRRRARELASNPVNTRLFDFDSEVWVERPAFNSVDADAVFEKIMRDEGAGWWMTRIGWTGVRLGAAWSSYRRAGWLSTAGRVAGLSAVFLAVALVLLSLIGLGAFAILKLVTPL